MTSGSAPPGALVEAVYRETEGNPFFVNEIVRLLVADGRMERAEEVTSWSVTIPQSVREVVGRRLDHLSEACNQVLTVGAVIGREFGLSALEKVCEVKGDRLLEAVEEAVAARVISEVPRSADHYSFSHALIRETLYEELSTPRRLRLHRQIGEVLEQTDPDAHLPQLAYHFCEAAPGGNVEKAIDYARRAAERAAGLHAHEEAAVHCERALQVLEVSQQTDESVHLELLLSLGDARYGTGEIPESKEAFRRAAEAARRLRDAEGQAHAALGYARHFEVGIVQEDVVAILRETLDALPDEDSALRARLMAQLGRELYFGSQEEFESLTRDGVAMARRCGDRAALLECLYHSLFAAIMLVSVKEHLAIADEVVRLAEEAQDKRSILNGLFSRIATLMILGRVDEVDSDIDAHAHLAAELRIPFYQWNVELFRGMRALFDGRLEEAERQAQLALAVGQKGSPQNAMQMFGAQLIAIRREQGRIGELEAPTKALIQQLPAVPAWRTGLLLIYAELDRREDARMEFETVAQDDFGIFPRDGNWPIALALLAETCCYLGDVRRAELLYQELLPHARLCILVGPVIDCYGSTSRLLGMLAATMEHWQDAERHFEDALEMNGRMGSGRWFSWTQYHYAAMLARRDGTGDREKAIQLVNEALGTTKRLGMKVLMAGASSSSSRSRDCPPPTSRPPLTLSHRPSTSTSRTCAHTPRPTAP